MFRIGWLVLAGTLGWSLAEAQYRPEVFAGPTLGQVRVAGANNMVAGLSLGFGVGLGSQSILLGPEALLLSSSNSRVRAFAIAARLRQRAGIVHPHLLASIGTYAWQTRTVIVLPELFVAGDPDWAEFDALTGSIGAGATVGGLSTLLSGVVEARWHHALKHDPSGGSRSLLAVTAGLRLTW